MEDRLPRKLAAILYADVAGYSRLTGEDEEGTHRRLSEYLDFISATVERHRGRVMHYAGDAVLAMFEAVVDALSCAAHIQRELNARHDDLPDERKVQFRIGVNSGDVIEDRGDIYGDGVNVAARLESLAEPGGICVSESVYTAVGNKLPLEYEDIGKQMVKNIAKPVRAYHARLQPGARLPEPPKQSERAAPASAKQRKWQAAAATAAIALIGVGGVLVWLESWAPREGATSIERMAYPLPDKPSIAVLPFDNLSGEASFERLADGITEDIISDLSRFRDLFVIARNSSFVYKGQPTDVRRVAGDLGVQYVLEGSLQSDGEQVRITAQLIDATTGNHVWSERYDRPLDDVFALQDTVTEKIVASLPGQHGVVARARRESARRKPAANVRAYDYYTLGMEQKHLFTKEGNDKAKELFDKAIALDPNFARAYVGLSHTRANEIDFGWTESRKKSMDEWKDLIRRAIELDPYDGEAHAALAFYYQHLNDFPRALAALDEALELNPNNADTLALGVWVLIYGGYPERALESVERAIRLNPHHPEWYFNALRDAYFHLRRFEDAIALTEKKRDPDAWDLLIRTLSYAQLGRREQAVQSAAEILRNEPDFSAEKKLTEVGTYARETDLHLFLDSAEKAGLPLCATVKQLARYPDMVHLDQCEAKRASG